MTKRTFITIFCLMLTFFAPQLAHANNAAPTSFKKTFTIPKSSNRSTANNEDSVFQSKTKQNPSNRAERRHAERKARNDGEPEEVRTQPASESDRKHRKKSRPNSRVEKNHVKDGVNN